MSWVALFIVVLVVIAILRCVVIVPQKAAYIVQRLGKYHSTLEAGPHVLVPLIDNVAYRHTLKEQALDVPPQQCITKDNITVEVDGILYLQVMDPAKASYGIGNYLFATTQLAQTTMRSEMGKLELDKSFEERMMVNGAIVEAVDKASDPWGVKVTRYEIKNITPPQTIRDAMEKQMRGWLEQGRVQAREEVVEGLENAPAAFRRLFEGQKFGKLVVHVAD
jgi:regulator of protease activity HflC (stomatin/prohibitin superfamily)